MQRNCLILILLAGLLSLTVEARSVQLTQLTGDDEATKVGVNTSKEILTTDSPNSGGVDKVFNLTTTAQEFKVGASAKVNRKYILMEAQTNRVKWGFNTSCNFSLKKNAFFMLPVGTNTTVYLCAESGTATMAGGEI